MFGSTDKGGFFLQGTGLVQGTYKLSVVYHNKYFMSATGTRPTIFPSLDQVKNPTDGFNCTAPSSSMCANINTALWLMRGRARKTAACPIHTKQAMYAHTCTGIGWGWLSMSVYTAVWGGSWEAAIFSSGFIIPLFLPCVQLHTAAAF